MTWKCLIGSSWTTLQPVNGIKIMTSLIYTNQKSKKKPANTAAKRQLEAEWELMKKKWEAKPIARTIKKAGRVAKFLPVVPEDRNPRNLPSVDSGLGSTNLKPANVYTGDKIVGLATMHKSNIVPVFSQNEAEDIARMRR